MTSSATRLIRAAQHDRTSAVGPSLEVYFDRLVRLARRPHQDLPGRANHDEDLALRAFSSVYRRVRDPERLLQLTDREDLWHLLAPRTISRAIDLIRRHRLRGVPGEYHLEQPLTCEPSPEEAATTADECRRLLDLLEEPELRQIALWKVEGYADEEIAARLDCVARTVERKVRRIRLLWKHELKDLKP